MYLDEKDRDTRIEISVQKMSVLFFSSKVWANSSLFREWNQKEKLGQKLGRARGGTHWTQNVNTSSTCKQRQQLSSCMISDFVYFGSKLSAMDMFFYSYTTTTYCYCLILVRYLVRLLRPQSTFRVFFPRKTWFLGGFKPKFPVLELFWKNVALSTKDLGSRILASPMCSAGRHQDLHHADHKTNNRWIWDELSCTSTMYHVFINLATTSSFVH